MAASKLADLSPADRALLDTAREARTHAYAPISRYKVGAAVRTADGTVVPGANVEHIVLGETSCAEKVAVYAAVAAGHRKFDTVAVYTDSSPPASPCGSCRQVLFHWGFTRAILANEAGELLDLTLSELLPHAFTLRDPPE